MLATKQQRKEAYSAFCETNNVPVFLLPWWNDADMGADNWDVVLVARNEEIVGALPYCLTRRWRFKGIGMPPVAPYQGPVIQYPAGQKDAARLAREEEITKALFAQLPKLAYFYQHTFPAFGNSLPLQWLGYQHTTRFTYLLPDLRNPEAVFAGFEKRARNAIRKAEKLVKVHKEKDPGLLFDIMEKTYQKQGKDNYFKRNHLQRLLTAVFEKNCGHLYVARDEKQNVHAALFVVWDGSTAYTLIQGSAPAYLYSNAASLNIWEAIQDASQHGIRKFDFTGSMMPGVQKFIRSFGAGQTPYYAISKENSFPFFLLSKLREVKNWVRGG